MSDAPLYGAGTQGALSSSSKVDPRDVADIDRELEAYLREKRSQQSINLDYSVDNQLSRLQEKAPHRLKKESSAEEQDIRPKAGVPPLRPVEKPASELPTKAVEQKKERVESAPMAKPPVKPKSEPQTPPVMNHEELIRSLEEKYSVGKEDGPQNKKEAVLKEERLDETPAEPAKKPSKEKERPAPPVVETKPEPPRVEVEVPQTEKEPEEDKLGAKEEKEVSSTILEDLKESMTPELFSELSQSIKEAEKLTPDSQRELVRVLLPRFRRNKERKELFERTQKELKLEFEDYLKDQVKDQRNIREDARAEKVSETIPGRRGDLKAPSSLDPTLQMSSENKERSAPPDYSAAPPVAEEPVQRGKSQEVTSRNDVVPKDVPTPKADAIEPRAEEAVTEQVALSPAEEVINRYKQHLINLDKKPAVLLYDPAQGFIRKAIDPNDPSLNLRFDYDETSQVAIVQVFDHSGAMVSETRTPVNEF